MCVYSDWDNYNIYIIVIYYSYPNHYISVIAHLRCVQKRSVTICNGFFSSLSTIFHLSLDMHFTLYSVEAASFGCPLHPSHVLWRERGWEQERQHEENTHISKI